MRCVQALPNLRYAIRHDIAPLRYVPSARQYASRTLKPPLKGAGQLSGVAHAPSAVIPTEHSDEGS